MTEIGRRSADIMNIAFKLRILSHLPGLRQNGCMTSRLDNPALVHCQRAEIAGAEAAAAGGQAELNLGNRGHAAQRFVARVIHRMPCPAIRKCIDVVHFLLGQWLCRRILHNIHRSVRFRQPFSGKRIRIAVLHRKALRVDLLLASHLLIIRKKDCVINLLRTLCLIACPVDKGDILHCDPRLQSVCNLYDRMLAHAVRNQVCSAVHEHRTFDRIRPVIIV